jgi:hypothetical protein
MRRKTVVINMAKSVFTIAGTVCLFNQLYGTPDKSLEYMESIGKAVVSIGGILAYYVVWLVVRQCAPARWRLRKNDVSHGDYRDTSRDSSELIGGMPRLTMRNIWGLVYGLGIVLFVFCYVLAGEQLVTLYSFSLGLVILCGQELISSRRPSDPVEVGIYIVITLFCFVSVLLVVVDSNTNSSMGDIYPSGLIPFIGGIVIPLVSPVFVCVIKYNTVYGLGSVMEICEFALPFMCILAGTSLIAEGVPVINADKTSLLCAILSPLLVVPAIITLVSSVLENRALDVLIPITLIVAIQYLLTDMENSMALCSIILSAVAMVCRIYSKEDGIQTKHAELVVEEIDSS